MMITGMFVLVAAAVLILFGVGQRVLDRMRLTDRQALCWMAAILIGGLVPNISIAGALEINIGGFFVPLVLCVYLFVNAGAPAEKARAFSAALLSAAAVWAIGVWFPDEPEAMPFDVNYLYGIVAGVLACLLGRSRRAAFIGGAMGVILADIGQGIVSRVTGLGQTIVLGGAGAFDAAVISAFSAVLLRELIGEMQERCTRKTGEPGRTFHKGEMGPAVLGANRDAEETDDELAHLPPEEYPEDGLLFGEEDDRDE